MNFKLIILFVTFFTFSSCKVNKKRSGTRYDNLKEKLLTLHASKKSDKSVVIMDSTNIKRNKKYIHNFSKVHLSFCDSIVLKSFNFIEIRDSLYYNVSFERKWNQIINLQNNNNFDTDSLNFVLLSYPVISIQQGNTFGAILIKNYYLKEVNELKWYQESIDLSLSVLINNEWNCFLSIPVK